MTNGILHAGTDLELEVMADLDGVRITVTDYGTATPSLVAAEPSASAAPAGTIPLGGLGGFPGVSGRAGPGGLARPIGTRVAADPTDPASPTDPSVALMPNAPRQVRCRWRAAEACCW